MNKTITVIKTTLILFIITSVSALLLAFVNEKTAPLIAQNENAKQSEALKSVMPEADDFIESKITNDIKSLAADCGCEINSLFTAVDSDGNKIGFCPIITGSGYSSGIQAAVGIDNDLSVTAVKIIASNETPGLGQNASKPEFKDQYIGKTYKIEVVKSNAGENQINAVSGATMTSEGVTRIVNLALETAKLKEDE